jgi:hypothetical protein
LNEGRRLLRNRLARFQAQPDNLKMARREAS